MSEMRVMGQRGDSKVIWNPDNNDEVEAAEKQFEQLVKKKRFRAFRVDAEGGKGEPISKFDKNAAKLIMVPPMAGGR
jgi:hypothetical protein